MDKTTAITLDRHFEDFVGFQVKTGRYGSANEVVRAGLRLLEDEESKLANLRRMLTVGEQSGQADYSYDSFIAELDDHAE